MGSKKFLFVASFTAISVIVAIALFSCVSVPDTTQGEAAADSSSAVFDPTRVSQQLYNSTRDEVQQFIEGLNTQIQNRNYEAWKAALSPDYFAEISSTENLRRISAQPAMRSRNIVLRTPQDYFTHVVVPSRQNEDASAFRVDDIEFVSINRVKAFTITNNRAGEEVRLRLYDLEKIENSWTIIN